ncbi:Tryptophan--tRNA ligase, cytoplasmic [Grifola frondosa]|uniref:Tryptophan--tRNA ligase, cytoplasmic n=1 Tax=Grifola frondosa TaxID=5627 RepID=A0A1C7MG02_GRIFR|nr:Tryptophan--tRNA ligase, cytoplasmic [Grifola frondosa]
MNDTLAQIRTKSISTVSLAGRRRQRSIGDLGGTLTSMSHINTWDSSMDDDEEWLRWPRHVDLNCYNIREYRAGRLLTGDLKAKCIQVLQDFVKGFHRCGFFRKANVTEEQLNAFMDGSRKIEPHFGKSKATAIPKDQVPPAQ